ncbi:MAG: NADH-quinone oxidoreductase subunit C [Deinococcus sp.]|nr:NADH-quinone oxidoreductase subunit C [Deinococcus sp.]
MSNKLSEVINTLRRLEGPLQVSAGPEQVTVVTAAPALAQVCAQVAQACDARLATSVGCDERLLGRGFQVYFVFAADRAGAFITVQAELDENAPVFPSLTARLPAANWHEREMHDLLGFLPQGHPDLRPLVLHPGWPKGFFPLRKDAQLPPSPFQVAGDLDMPGVTGQGVYQLPVGPIHAGVIEPGHFRFFLDGEQILSLEAQLFYVHRGAEKLIEGRTPALALPVVERLCATCSASHAIGFCQAVEALSGVEIPPRARHLRTLYLELERLYNHLGDMGNICAGLSYHLGNYLGASSKEALVSLNAELTGHRYLMGVAALGGVRADLPGHAPERIRTVLAQAYRDLQELLSGITTSPSVLDRLENTGRLSREVALELALVGPAARASGVDRDARRDHPYLAYSDLKLLVPLRSAGDVYSRLMVRADEAQVSMDLVNQLLRTLPAGPVRTDVPPLPPRRQALSWIESPRGESVHWVQGGNDGTIYRYRLRSASYQNWPAVPQAVLGNIVPDFPLVNKSFELCYSCTDR